jgi:hypothetical protein
MKNKKLVELGILSEDENSGVSAISLVENPAIEVDFLYFREEKFVKPSAGESENEFIGRCIPVLRDEGKPEEQAIAICYSYWENRMEKMEITPNPCWKGYEPIGLKDKGGRKVPNCVKMEGYDFEELDIFGYKTRFFFICPGATATFEHLISMNPDDETQGMIRAAAVIADRVFEIEKEVVDEGVATPEQLQEAVVLVNDFYDIIYEIDEELGMVHNVQYMEGHLELILSYIPDEMSIDTAGLPPYVDEIGKKKEMSLAEKLGETDLSIFSEFELSVLERASELGIPDKENFATETTINKAREISEVVPSGQKITKGETLIRYKYTKNPLAGGGRAQRGFCKSMLYLNRFYLYDEIRSLDGSNEGFGLNGAATYNIFEYRGGSFCKHYWKAFKFEKPADGSKTIITESPSDDGPTDNIPRVNPPSTGGQSFSKCCSTETHFSALRFADEEQKIVVGPAMIPEMAIPRRDEDGDIYYVKFSAETIKEIMMKFMKEARTNATNQDHQEDNAAGAYVYESWLVEDPENDKANTKYGFNVPAGTWMVSMKVDDKETWKRVKNGELRGFSVEGFFSDLDEIQGLKKYLKIMKILKD